MVCCRLVSSATKKALVSKGFFCVVQRIESSGG
jgi:hypothetical protein